MIHDSWFTIHDSWFTIHDSWFISCMYYSRVDSASFKQYKYNYVTITVIAHVFRLNVWYGPEEYIGTRTKELESRDESEVTH